MESSESDSAGFPPVSRADARVLVLGSLPGQASLEAAEYYAHPRNDFWPIMGQLTGAVGSYSKRCEQLCNNGVALWDVLASAQRPGSLDSNIHMPSAVPNDFDGFFQSHPDIRLVCFNGRKAESMFQRFAVESLPAGTRMALLPSSSPAHATLTLKEKLARWRGIIEPALTGGFA